MTKPERRKNDEARMTNRLVLLVPTLWVGTPVPTLCVGRESDHESHPSEQSSLQ